MFFIIVAGEVKEDHENGAGNGQVDTHTNDEGDLDGEANSGRSSLIPHMVITTDCFLALSLFRPSVLELKQ